MTGIVSAAVLFLALAAADSREELRDRGYSLALTGRCLEAIEPLEQALRLYREDRERPGMLELRRDGSLISEINLLTRLSSCHNRLRRLDDLLAVLREAVAIHRILTSRVYLRDDVSADLLTGLPETFRRQIAGDLEKIQAQDASRLYFEEVVALFLDLGQETEALVAAEKARARAFTDLLAAGTPKQPLPEGWIGQSPSLPVTAIRLQGVAERFQSTVVEYMLTDRRLIIWVLSPQGEVRVETVAVARDSIESLVRDLMQLMSRPGRGVTRIGPDSPEERQTEILRQLYGLLIAPIAGHLPRPASPGRVIFIPQDLLFLVPFPALLDPKNQPLLDHWMPATAPALGILDALPPPAGGAWAGSEVLVAGNPALPPGYESYSDLQGAEREAVAVAERLGARPLLREAATKEALIAAMPQTRLIHIASHGLLEHGRERDIPGALLLASEMGDGLLTAREIATLKLRADLVVLSACETGSGRITGDGVVGLARAFLGAGARGVVVSLWQVGDEATAPLMDDFYGFLAQGEDPAKALRASMLAARRRNPDPRTWAAFTFIGAGPKPLSAALKAAPLQVLP